MLLIHVFWALLNNGQPRTTDTPVALGYTETIVNLFSFISSALQTFNLVLRIFIRSVSDELKHKLMMTIALFFFEILRIPHLFCVKSYICLEDILISSGGIKGLVSDQCFDI